ncbi:MAG: DUF1778 domain-containing protein [Planctomycetaceae bacterium]
MTSKSARLEARLSQRHQTLIQHAAALRGQSVTDFVVAASLAEAQKIIAENEIIEVSVADQQRFAEAILKPKAPSAALTKAAHAHRRLIEPS